MKGIDESTASAARTAQTSRLPLHSLVDWDSVLLSILILLLHPHPQMFRSSILPQMMVVVMMVMLVWCFPVLPSTASSVVDPIHLSSSASASPSVPPPSLIASFYYVNWTFPTRAQTDSYLSNHIYRYCLLTGVKLHSMNETSSPSIFFSLPRWLSPLVPATLALYDEHSNTLLPYPSWEANNVSNPNALQSVLGFEIDSFHRLWVLDQGRVAGQAPKVEGPIKLVIYSLLDNREIQRYTFSFALAPPSTSFLNDIVVDTSHNKAYISDSGIPVDPDQSTHTAGGLYVYDFELNTMKRVLGGHYSTQADPLFRFSVGGNPVQLNAPMMTGADGLALTPDGKWLFFAPLTSRQLYRVNTDALWSDDGSGQSAQSVQWLGAKPGNSDGIACTNWQISQVDPDTNEVEDWYEIIASDLENDRLISFKAPLGRSDAISLLSSSSFSVLQTSILAMDHDMMQWIDTIGFDNRGNGSVVFTSNKLQMFTSIPQTMKWETEVNLRVWKVDSGSKSYLFNMTDGPLPFDDENKGESGWIGGFPILVVVILLVALAAFGFAVKGSILKNAEHVSADDANPLVRPSNQQDERKEALLEEEKQAHP